MTGRTGISIEFPNVMTRGMDDIARRAHLFRCFLFDWFLLLLISLLLVKEFSIKSIKAPPFDKMVHTTLIFAENLKSN